MLDDHLIHQCHEHSRFKIRALFLLFQHMKEYLDVPPTSCLIFFLLGNRLNFLAEPCVLGEQRLVIVLKLILIPLHPGVFIHQLPDARRHAQRLILQPRGSLIEFCGIKASSSASRQAVRILSF